MTDSKTPTALLGLDPLTYGIPPALAGDIALVDTLLGQVLASDHETEVIRIARQLYDESTVETTDSSMDLNDSSGEILTRYPELKDPIIMRKVLRAYTILFQVMNTAEQKEIVRANRKRQAVREEKDSTPRPESIAEAVTRLKSDGLTAAQMQALLDKIEICPTITAHPTEARRRSVMDKLLAIADALAERGVAPDVPRLDCPLNSPSDSAEHQLIRNLTALWNTDELRAGRVTVADEVNNSVYFFQRTILDVVAWLHDDLRTALAKSWPGETFNLKPFLRYHSWVGGDRDGNPNVTPDITWNTLIYHKRVILGHYLVRIDSLRRELSLSSRLLPVSAALTESLVRDAEAIRLSTIETERYSMQLYAHKLTFMEHRLRATLRKLDGMGNFRGDLQASSQAAQSPYQYYDHLAAASASDDDSPADVPANAIQSEAYDDADEFVADLKLMQESLRQGRASLLADEGALPHLIVQAETFGFHLASLDIRQHSREHGKVLDEIFVAAGVIAPGAKPYSELSESEKLSLLAHELRSPRPLLARGWTGSENTTRALEVFEAVRKARHYISADSVTCYVISMTHEVSDMLEVLVLAKEAGLVRWRRAQSDTTRAAALVLESDLDIVPLFETIEDLQSCDQLLRDLFADDTFRLHLDARGNYQELMLGYSDSSKDGGYLAANWNLQDTQDRLAGACREAGVDFRLFHGRGGTVGRGGGRASRAILSQPRGSFTGRIRFTEQGEVVSFRYSLRPMAHRHLEQIVNSVLLAAADDNKASGEGRSHDKYGPAMADMAAHSRNVYRKMVHDDPDFWGFYTQATPIGHISRLPITSRPAMRGGGKLSGLEELRAIPWVFAWVQSRYVVPGWYGLGAGLEHFAGNSPENLELLRTMYREWAFFRTVVDNAQLELVRTHLPTTALYAARVKPAELGERFHSTIVAEYRRSCDWVLKLTEQKRLLDTAPVVQSTVRLRNPIVLPLNKLQVALMALWEQQPENEAGPGSPWYDAILLSITGVAAGMQSTG